MAIIFNGTTVDKVIFNGAEMETVKFDGVVVFESKPQLATPQNVTADGTNVSWDEVENATSYEVLADGASIGTVTPSTGETWVLNENYSDLTTINFTVKFISNNTTFNTISLDGSVTVAQRKLKYDDTVAWGVDTEWTNEAYRTIVLDTPATGDLLTWLTANGVKQ